MKTGVVTDPSLEMLERASAHALTAATLPANAAAVTASSDGSRRFCGIEPEKLTIAPDFASPCGMSAV